MRLTNKVTNAFFGIIAAISLFMPLFGYKTLLTGNEFSLADMISFLKSIDPSADASLLSNLGTYGYKEEAIAVLVFFILMLVSLVALLILSFVNVPYIVRMINSGAGLVFYILAVVFFTKICKAFVNGTIPASAVTSLSAGAGEGNILTALIGSFAQVSQMGVTTGVYVGIACFVILFGVNLVFFIFRKKFNESDGIKPKKRLRKQRKTKKA